MVEHVRQGDDITGGKILWVCVLEWFSVVTAVNGILLGGEMEKYGLINIVCRLIYMRRSFFISRSLGLVLGCKDTLSLESSASWCHHHLHHIEPPSLFYSYH